MQYETDEQAVARALKDLPEGEAINHGTARTIASWFNEHDERALTRVLGAIPEGVIVEPITANILASWSTDSGGEVARFVGTGELPAPEHDEDENIGDFLWAMGLGAEAGKWAERWEAVAAFQTYLVSRDRAENYGPVPGWSKMRVDVDRHVDRPHESGTLADCPGCDSAEDGASL